METSLCPCQSHASYVDCCGLYIEAGRYAPTPEALMRSRYTAFVLGRLDYIEATMHGQAAKNYQRTTALDRAKAVTWKGLRILNTRMKGVDVGFVTFEASFEAAGKKQQLREKSEFHKIQDRWFYTNGKLLNPHTSSHS